MIWPPSILWISIREEGGKRFRLWLPLFLLWWLIIPMLLVVPWISGHSRYHPTKIQSPFRAAVWLVVAFCCIRGLTVSVKGKDTVYIAFR